MQTFFLFECVTSGDEKPSVRVRELNYRRCNQRMDEANIIDLYWSRNERAIEETDKTFGKSLLSLSRRILENRQDAEENVYDTYMRTWESIPPQRPVYFRAFLMKICRCLALDRLDRRTAGKRNAELVSLTEEMASCIPDKRIDDRMEGKELGRLLDRFLGELPKDSRLIFLRRYLYLDTVAEIARRYGFSESKVKMQLKRTRTKLHAYLNKEGITV